jgi:hypothetical protein
VLCYTPIDTFPRPDTIHSQIQKHLPHSTLVLLSNVYNRIWSEGSFPSKLGEAIVIPILKVDKNRFLPSSYSPVCLTKLCLQGARESVQLQASLDTRKPRPPLEQPVRLLMQPFVSGSPRNSGGTGKTSLPD